jgi:hypothetical protein
MTESGENEESIHVRKFFAIMSKSSRKDLCKIHGVLTTFLEQVPKTNVPENVAVAPGQKSGLLATGTH